MQTSSTTRREPDSIQPRGMRRISAANVHRIGPHLDRQRDLADQIACMRADDHTADDAMCLCVEKNLREPSSPSLAMARADADQGNTPFSIACRWPR